MGAEISLVDLAYTLSRRRTVFEHRLAAVAPSAEALAAALGDWLSDTPGSTLAVGTAQATRSPRVFVFPGQGGQWIGMGRQLLAQEPAFRAALAACDQALRPYTDWSLIEQLTAGPETSRLTEIGVIQPAVFSIQVALAALWRSWGITPDVVIGHSMGEVAAAHVAGALSLDDAGRIIALRSKLLTRVRGQGAMASVELSRADAEKAIRGYEDRVAIAVCNSTTATVLSGDPQALREILAPLEQRDVFCRWIKVDVASHSPQMDPLLPELRELLKGVQPRQGQVPIYSTVTGTVSDGSNLDTNYWARNLREPVQFWHAVEQAIGMGARAFIELSPHPTLLHAVRQGFQQSGQTGLTLPSLRSEEDELAVMLGSLGALFTNGYPVDWDAICPRGNPIVELPNYPWQHESLWLDTAPVDPGALRSSRDSASRHPMIGNPVNLAHSADSHLWEFPLDTRRYPYLDDHRVQDTVVLPGTAYLEMALAASNQILNGARCSLTHVTYQEALFLPAGARRRVQVVITAAGDGAKTFRIYSRDEADSADGWTLHANGAISVAGEEQPAPSLDQTAREAIRERCAQQLEGGEFYRLTAAMGNQWGPAFQGISRLWRCAGEALAELHIPSPLEADAARYQFHPAVLDASGQVLAATVALEQAEGQDENAFVLGGIDRVTVYNPPSARMWSHILPGAGRHDDILEGNIQVFDDAGNLVVEVIGLRLKYLDPRDQRQGIPESTGEWLYGVEWQPRPRAERAQARSATGRWLLFAHDGEQAHMLTDVLSERGAQCISVFPGPTYQRLAEDRFQIRPASSDDAQRLLGEAFGAGQPPSDVVHLWSLGAQPAVATLAAIEEAQVLGSTSAVALVQALVKAGGRPPPRLWLVTQGAQAVDESDPELSCAQAPLWGLGRTIFREHPDLQCRLIDLAPGDRMEDLLSELWDAGDGENQIAFRDHQRHVARLVRYTPPSASPEADRLAPAAGRPFALEIDKPGILDNLMLRAGSRPVPGPGEVEIEVRAAGLNFRDVMLSMGVYPGQDKSPALLGWECAGTIATLGPNVAGLHAGDEVIAIIHPSFRSFATTKAELVVRKPANLSFEEAATLPTAYLTAYYALHHLARLQPGERILIHSAAGGVGLAAIQVARWLGAEIFATAGSAEKRAYLQSIGVQHVMDSRSLTFVDEIRAITGGAGVDVVLNSLAGAALPQSLALVREYGRFVEMGKKDILENSQLGMRPFEKNVSFFAIDIVQMFRERPASISPMLSEIVRLVEAGTLAPLPRQGFPVGAAVDAFRMMAQARHIGKIVLSFDDPDVLVAPARRGPIQLRGDGTYLVTGGLGGLGLTVARWLAEHGARSLLLAGRSPLPAREQWGAVPPESKVGRQIAGIRGIEAAGATVHLAAVDVADEARLHSFLEAFARTGAPPIRGVIHAAGVVTYQSVLDLDAAALRDILRAKVSGGWLLHRAFEHTPLDFFILFSSGSSLLSSPLLGGYAAANAFLDTLAYQRRALGQPGLSINWGFWDEVGMVARYQQEEGRDLVPRGMGSFSPQQGLEVLERLMGENPRQVAVMPASWPAWSRAYPAAAQSPFLAELVRNDGSTPGQREEGSSAPGLTRDALLRAEPAVRLELLKTHFRDQVAKIVGLAAPRLDVLRPLNRLGFDSLMAVELKNRVQADMGVSVPVVKFLQGFSVADLTGHVLEQLTQASPPPAIVQRSDGQPDIATPPTDPKTTATAGGSDWEEGEV